MKKNPNSVLFRKKILLRMKLTILFLILFTMQISASVSIHGQVTLNVQNESIRDVFREIENQSPYRFFYNEAFADLNKRININVDDKDNLDPPEYDLDALTFLIRHGFLLLANGDGSAERVCCRKPVVQFRVGVPASGKLVPRPETPGIPLS